MVYRSEAEIDLLKETEKLLLPTLAKLDLRGTNEQVTQALAIVHEVFNAVIVGDKFTVDEVFKSAMQRCEWERLR